MILPTNEEMEPINVQKMFKVIVSLKVCWTPIKGVFTSVRLYVYYAIHHYVIIYE